VGLFRRREPLHERLAREGGLRTDSPAEPSPPGWTETGVHGVPRARTWDTVVAVEAEGVQGDRALFVAVDDDTLVVEEGADPEPLAAALEDVLQPPYRAEATRRGETQWAVGLRRIQVVELPDDPEGDEVVLTVSDGERTLVVDGRRAFGTIPQLEALAAARGGSAVVQAGRLDGSLWEVEVMPL
jgi:hypothetical protein